MENTRISTIMHKIYKEKNLMKKNIEELKKNQNSDHSESSASVKNIIKEKDKKIVELTKRNKEQAEEIAVKKNSMMINVLPN